MVPRLGAEASAGAIADNNNAVRAYKRNIDQFNIQQITAREINADF